jgi:DNA-binding HxlR family transcriptional regulator
MIELTSANLCEVLHRTYEGQVCSAARALEVIGERWTLLILRDAFLGVRRFDEIQRDLGISRGLLTARLRWLCDEGILERRRYQERPERFEYRLTQKGRDLWPVMMALMKWGDRYESMDGPPRLVLHRECGGEVTEHSTCSRCGSPLTVRDVETRPGPGADPRQGDRPPEAVVSKIFGAARG